jgi:two-component system response regulator FixJ
MPDDGTVFVVDNEPAAGDSVAALLAAADLPLQTFRSAEEFLQSYDARTPGCLLLDVRTPGPDGLAPLHELARRDVRIPTIIITACADVPMTIAAFRAGALDFFQQPCDTQELVARIREVLRFAAAQHAKAERRATAQARVDTLSAREREVMHLVVRGHPNKEIATLLDLSQRTVEVHRANMMRKMRVDNLADLVRLVSQAGADEFNPLSQ